MLLRIGFFARSSSAAAQFGRLLLFCVLLAQIPGAAAAQQPFYITDSLSPDGSCVYGSVEILRPVQQVGHTKITSAPEAVLASGTNCSYGFRHVPQANAAAPVVYAISFRYQTLDPRYSLKTSFDASGWVVKAKRHCFHSKREVPCVHNTRWERNLMAAHRLYTVNGMAAWIEDSSGQLAAPDIQEKTGRRYITVYPDGSFRISSVRPKL